MQYHWDEEQKLSGAKKDPGLRHYLYDHNGERIMKSSLYRNRVALDGENGPNSFVADPYTVYVNPYYVATAYSESIEASKHYYMGSQRVASALTSEPFVPYDDNPSEEPEDPDPEPESSGSGLIGAAVNLQSLLDHFEMEEGVDYDMTALLEMESVEPGTGYSSVSDFLNSTDCNQDEQCLCEESLYWAQEAGYDCEESQVMYWYHPDYLGNTEFITDLAGDPFQYFWYSPFGESIEEQHSGDGFYSLPFRFNAKELDQETGNYYYGARYYNPKTSIWLSVDQRADWYPHTTPYAYVMNNPVNLTDPTGMSAESIHGSGGSAWPPEKGLESEFEDGQLHTDEDGSWRLDKEAGAWVPENTELDAVTVGTGEDNSSTGFLNGEGGGFNLVTDNPGDVIGQSQETREGFGPTRNIDGVLPSTNARSVNGFWSALLKGFDLGSILAEVLDNPGHDHSPKGGGDEINKSTPQSQSHGTIPSADSTDSPYIDDNGDTLFHYRMDNRNTGYRILD